MKLQLFNGGLNTRQAPELIKPNEAVVCNNVNNDSEQLVSANGVGAGVDRGIMPYYFAPLDTWFEDANVRDYLDYQSKLYWTDGTKPKKFDGTNTYDLGIDAPTTAPGVDVPGSYQFVYTYYNADDGTESQPSPINTQTLPYTLNLTPSDDLQVTHMRTYVIGPNILEFTLIHEDVNTPGTGVGHTASSITLLSGILTSELNGKPPAELRYINQAYGVFFGAVGPKLYFSRDIGNPNYWPETNYIDFDEDITGIAIIPNGVVVFTYFETYLISGTNSSTFVKYLLDSSQGCIDNRTIVEYRNTVIFVSTDGVCLLKGSYVEVLSKFKLGKQTFGTINAVAHDEAYYLQLTNQTILCLDTRYSQQFKYYAFNTEYLVVANDILYGADATTGLLHPLFAGDPVTLTYQTGNLTEGSSSELKMYNSIYIDGTGTFTIQILLDGVVVNTYTDLVLTAKPTELTVPQAQQRATKIGFNFSGIGTIREVEYKAVGRQNGR